MKTARYFILPCLAVLVFIYTCEKDKSSSVFQSGKLIKISGCTGTKSSAGAENTADSLSCIVYAYDNVSNKLMLKHIHAGFNCCPEKITGDINFVYDSIIMEESEEDPLCDCNCLYDLEFELTGISEKTYTLHLIEPYAGDQEKLEFVMDLVNSTQGTFCVIRKGYPWGLN